LGLRKERGERASLFLFFNLFEEKEKKYSPPSVSGLHHQGGGRREIELRPIAISPHPSIYSLRKRRGGKGGQERGGGLAHTKEVGCLTISLRSRTPATKEGEERKGRKEEDKTCFSPTSQDKKEGEKRNEAGLWSSMLSLRRGDVGGGRRKGGERRKGRQKMAASLGPHRLIEKKKERGREKSIPPSVFRHTFCASS